MRVSECDILIIPGLGNSAPEHWQSRWQSKLPSARRVEQPDWNRPDRAQWTGAIAAAVSETARPVVLIAHSTGVAAVAHAAPLLTKPVAGAFLVGMSGCNCAGVIPGLINDFASVPRDRLPFPSLLIASRDDPCCSYEVAAGYANAWGADLVDAGDAGPINIASGHGPWPEGLMRLAAFLKRLGQAESL